ncbi:antitoxin Xre/MbcA/ParS toxin-binding domain-containing protein [Pseudomonas sp. NPDC088444]|uniref:type II RES/Xre toxin-antitoxin system antitoxin n=1 Tax=Pseudomonas sp. NPDC088444 TaxID=3364456 RepID=UPI00384BDC19
MPAIFQSSTNAAPAFWLIADQLNTRNETERLAYIRTGFPPGWVKAVRTAFQLSNSQLERLLNASMSTLERRLKERRPLDIVSSERLDRIASLAVRAAEVFNDQQTAQHWIISPNRALNDQTPITLCETDIGALQARRVLAALEHGGVV